MWWWKWSTGAVCSCPRTKLCPTIVGVHLRPVRPSVSGVRIWWVQAEMAGAVDLFRFRQDQTPDRLCRAANSVWAQQQPPLGHPECRPWSNRAHLWPTPPFKWESELGATWMRLKLKRWRKSPRLKVALESSATPPLTDATAVWRPYCYFATVQHNHIENKPPLKLSIL